jgi:cytochrome d ubiquinol oxidase subunit I
MVPFQSYHIMVGCGMFFILMSMLGLFYWKLGKLFEQRWLMWMFVFAVLAAVAANECGWVAAQVGRQPWVVYGLLRTHDAVSHSARAPEMVASICMFSFVYALLFCVWVTVLNDKIQTGPERLEQLEEANAPAHEAGESFWQAAARTMKRQFFRLTNHPKNGKSEDASP